MQEKVEKSIFELAQKAVVDLMLHDPYRRFLETEFYADMLENLNAKSGNVSNSVSTYISNGSPEAHPRFNNDHLLFVCCCLCSCSLWTRS